MTNKDIFSNCSQLQTEIEQATTNLNQVQTKITQIEGKIQKLESAKIATRLEFGSRDDPALINQLNQTLGEIENTISSLKIEHEFLTDTIKDLKYEINTLQTNFNSMGCANII